MTLKIRKLFSHLQRNPRISVSGVILVAQQCHLVSFSVSDLPPLVCWPFILKVIVSCLQDGSCCCQNYCPIMVSKAERKPEEKKTFLSSVTRFYCCFHSEIEAFLLTFPFLSLARSELHVKGV